MLKKVIIPGVDNNIVVHSELTVFDTIIARNQEGKVVGPVVQSKCAPKSVWTINIGNTGNNSRGYGTLQECILGYSKDYKYTFEVVV